MKPVLDTSAADLDDPLAFSVKGATHLRERGPARYAGAGPRHAALRQRRQRRAPEGRAWPAPRSRSPPRARTPACCTPPSPPEHPRHAAHRARRDQPRLRGRPAPRKLAELLYGLHTDAQGLPSLRRAHARPAGRHPMTTFTLRRALTVFATTGSLLLAATACSEGSSAEQAPTTSVRFSSSALRPPLTGFWVSASPPGSPRSTPMDIRVTIDGQEVEATLNDSPAARDLALAPPSHPRPGGLPRDGADRRPATEADHRERARTAGAQGRRSHLLHALGQPRPLPPRRPLRLLRPAPPRPHRRRRRPALRGRPHHRRGRASTRPPRPLTRTRPRRRGEDMPPLFDQFAPRNREGSGRRRPQSTDAPGRDQPAVSGTPHRTRIVTRRTATTSTRHDEPVRAGAVAALTHARIRVPPMRRHRAAAAHPTARAARPPPHFSPRRDDRM